MECKTGEIYGASATYLVWHADPDHGTLEVMVLKGERFPSFTATARGHLAHFTLDRA